MGKKLANSKGVYPAMAGQKAKSKKQRGNGQEELIKLEKKNQQLEEQLKRALADYQNLVKDVERQKLNMAEQVKGELFLGLIDIFTDLKIAVDNIDKVDENNPWLQGILNLLQQYKDLLARYNVEEITFKKGDKFDYNQAQAIGVVEGKDDGIVASMAEPGYRIGDRVLKPAGVIVYKKQ